MRDRGDININKNFGQFDSSKIKADTFKDTAKLKKKSEIERQDSLFTNIFHVYGRVIENYKPREEHSSCGLSWGAFAHSALLRD